MSDDEQTFADMEAELMGDDSPGREPLVLEPAVDPNELLPHVEVHPAEVVEVYWGEMEGDDFNNG